ncbi:MAG: T9SS type A sorting domain-containing protein [Bacteroidales bacterium]|nr:T9SS type A sorting domain-containing protein [Bacteroidales bacterium]
MKNKTILCMVTVVALLLLTTTYAQAQTGNGGNVYITHIDGSNSLYSLTPQGSITFEGDSVMLINTNGSSTNVREAIGQIAKVTFDKTSTSLPEVTESGLFLYPNPVDETLHIMGLQGHNTYTIYATDGRQLMQGTLNDGTINVLQLRSGLYLIRIGNETIKFSKR